MRKILAVLLLALLLGGCAGEESVPTPPPTPAPTPTPTPEPSPEPVVIGGKSFDAGAEYVDLRNTAATADELAAALAKLPALTGADLYGCALTNAEKLSLAEAFPELFFGWEVDVLGVTADSRDTYICLDNIPMTDASELEALLPLLPYMEKIDMCGCGLDDETMYGLNCRHEDIRFIWVAHIGGVPRRTDTTYFNHNDIGMASGVSDEKLDIQLRYFPDLTALDLGHSAYSLRRCDWLQYTPKLEYLILADCEITDVTPIGELRELRYLEVFSNRHLTDISPLGKLPKIETLNLSVTGITDVSPLQNCTTLRYCWLNYCWALGEETVTELAAALPDCVVNHTPYGPTSGGWRELDVYFEMRDAFHSDYMGGDRG